MLAVRRTESRYGVRDAELVAMTSLKSLYFQKGRGPLYCGQGSKHGQVCASHDTPPSQSAVSPRPADLIETTQKGGSDDPRLDRLYEDAIRDSIERFEAAGSPVVTDGEQRKYHNLCTYCVHGLPNTAPDGFIIPFSDGHTRRLSRLTSGPFRYRRYADCYLDVAMRFAHVPVKQAVISPSALSLMHPAEKIPVNF
jgi:hypothetical protein